MNANDQNSNGRMRGQVLDPPGQGPALPTAPVTGPQSEIGTPTMYMPPAAVTLQSPGSAYMSPQQARSGEVIPGRQQPNPVMWLVLIGVAILILMVGFMIVTWIVVGSLVRRVEIQPPGSLVVESQSVQLGVAKSAGIDLDMNTGNIKVVGGSANLVDAGFTYNMAQWKPEVRYNVSGDTGKLVIQQPDSKVTGVGDVRYDWDLRLNNDVPMDLKVNLGVGNADLDLSGLNLSKLDIDTHTGKTTVDLTGPWKNNLDATIMSGIGSAVLRLPSDVGVRVNAGRGIGNITVDNLQFDGTTYTNEAYGKSPVTLDIKVTSRIGDLRLETVSR